MQCGSRRDFAHNHFKSISTIWGDNLQVQPLTIIPISFYAFIIREPLFLHAKNEIQISAHSCQLMDAQFPRSTARKWRRVLDSAIPEFKLVPKRNTAFFLAKVLQDNIAVEFVWVRVFVATTPVLVRPLDVQITASFAERRSRLSTTCEECLKKSYIIITISFIRQRAEDWMILPS